MIPVKQQYRHKPEIGIYGDCHSACLASILNLDIDDVPHFGFDNPMGETFKERIQEWLSIRNLYQVDIAFITDLYSLLRMMKSINPNIYYILGGQSKSGVNHSVVCYNDEIVNDPSLNNSGIVGPDSEGYYWISTLTKLEF